MACCPICNKKYVRIGALRRHLVTCEIIHKSPKRIEIPTQEDMFIIFQKLVKDNEILKQRISELEKKVHKKKQKKNILSWLNENITDVIEYDKWCKEIKIDYSDYEYICNYNFIDCFYRIITNADNNPIKCFKQKKNMYIFNGKNWEELDIKKMTDLIFIIQKRLLDHLMDWKDSLGQKFYYDKNMELYTKNSSKLLGNGNIEDKIRKIYNKLYEKNKVNINDIVEYNITF